MQHIFIINPTAGKNDETKKISKNVHALFATQKVAGTYRIEIPSSQEETVNIARKYAQRNEQVILYACGGDGTLNDVVNGCMNYENVILAHIPIGTGNDFIKFFGSHAKEDFKNLEELINGHVVEIDVLDVNGNYSLNITNVGLDAMIAFNVDKFKKIPLISGQTAYKMSLAYSFFTSLSHPMKIVVDGVEEKEDCFSFVVCANAKYYGGNYCAAPYANLQDGLMDVILIPKISRPKILKLMKVYEKGEHLKPQYSHLVHYHKAKKVEIHAKQPLQICIEGEKIMMNDPVIQIAPNKIKLLVPKKYTKADTLIES